MGSPLPSPGSVPFHCPTPNHHPPSTRPCPYRNCSSGRWENAPSWISEKAAFTSVLQGTPESVLGGVCRDCAGAVRGGQGNGFCRHLFWKLPFHLTGPPPGAVFPFSMPAFIITLPYRLSEHQWPQARLPPQPKEGSITHTFMIL